MDLRRPMVALLLFALGVSACGGTPAEVAPTPTGAAESPAPAPTPVRGGTLVVAISSDPGHLNPAITTSGATHTAAELMYDGLVTLDEQLRPQPGLAERWDITDDGATYTFHLRQGVEWHDGTPFTSADVKFAFEQVLLQFHSRTRASVGQALDRIETPDEHTVVFRFKFPYAPLLQQLDVTEAPIVPRHIYEGTDPQTADANLAPVGTGPFRFVSYTKDQEIRLARNERYFLDDLPYLDEVVMRIIPEDLNQIAALESGEVDWIWNVPGPELERLRGDDRFQLLSTPVNPGGANCIMTVSFNLDRPVLQDVRTRRAFAHALDRQAYLDRILFGQGRVADAPIHSGIPFAHATGLDMPDFDPDASRQLLDEVGWVEDPAGGPRVAQGVDGVPDGTPLRLTFLVFPTFVQYGELMREQLRQVGIELDVTALEPPVFVERVFTDRDFDTNIISYCNGTDPEIGVRRMYISSNIAPIPFSNAAAYRNPEVDALFDEAMRTIDLDARRDVYRRIQEILVRDLPYFWIVETESTRAHRATCEGFAPFGHFALRARCTG